MKHIDKLIKLLDSDKQVKKERTKLEFGCNILVHDSNGGEWGWEKDFWYEGKIVDNGIVRYRLPYSDNRDDDEICEEALSGSDEILGLPLQERFIIMYCENTKKLMFNKYQDQIQIKNVFTGNQSKLIQIDNTKDFSEQNDDVYEQIFLALTTLID